MAVFLKVLIRAQNPTPYIKLKLKGRFMGSFVSVLLFNLHRLDYIMYRIEQ